MNPASFGDFGSSRRLAFLKTAFCFALAFLFRLDFGFAFDFGFDL
jgi:hypothetical protein